MKKEKMFFKSNKGITLIAVIVTIIVLTILAGMGLAMVNGNDGVLKRATKAQYNHTESVIKEEITRQAYERVTDMMVNSQSDARSKVQDYIKAENLSNLGVSYITWEEDNKEFGKREFEVTFNGNKKIKGYMKPDGTIIWKDWKEENYSYKDDWKDKISEEISKNTQENNGKNSDITYIDNYWLGKHYGYQNEDYGVEKIEWKSKFGTTVVKITFEDGTIQDGYISNGEMVWEKLDVNFDLEYTRGIEEVTLYPGQYLLQVWGGQGGKSNHGTAGGKGGYSEGKITITETTKVYVVVGEMGEVVQGGYNGGGTGSNNNDDAAGGGGATHIAFKTGLLYELVNDKSSIILVAGGGGGSGCSGTYGGVGRRNYRWKWYRNKLSIWIWSNSITRWS